MKTCSFPESDDDSNPENKNKSRFRTLNEDEIGEIQKEYVNNNTARQLSLFSTKILITELGFFVGMELQGNTTLVLD